MGLFYVDVLIVDLYLGSGYDCLSFARGMSLVIVGWLPYGICLCLLRADAPLLFLGEVLSDFRFDGGLGLLYSFWLFVGHCPFGNKLLIIQKKETKIKMEWTIYSSIKYNLWSSDTENQ